MKILLIVAAALVIAAVLFLPVRIYFSAKGKDISLVLKIGVIKLRLLKKKKKKDNAEKKEKEPKKLTFEDRKRQLEEYIGIFNEIKGDAAKTLDYFSDKAAVFENVTCNSEFGFENAMHTGIFTGLINGFVYSVLGFLHRHSTLSEMNVNLKPVFDEPCFNMEIGCIVRLKLAHTVIASVKVLKILWKIRKKGKEK